MHAGMGHDTGDTSTAWTIHSHLNSQGGHMNVLRGVTDREFDKPFYTSRTLLCTSQKHFANGISQLLGTCCSSEIAADLSAWHMAISKQTYPVRISNPPTSFESSTFATAVSISLACFPIPNEYFSIMATERIIAAGFTMPFPAISGALP